MRQVVVEAVEAAHWMEWKIDGTSYAGRFEPSYDHIADAVLALFQQVGWANEGGVHDLIPDGWEHMSESCAEQGCVPVYRLSPRPEIKVERQDLDSEQPNASPADVGK